MEFEKESVIGIVGGMGPQAGLALFNSILCNTKATTDQQHFSTILMSFPGHIEDRTAFLEGRVAVNPAFAIAGVIRKLEKAGATVAGIACNTSHAAGIYDVVMAELDKNNCRIHLLNMPYETCLEIKELYPAVRKVGVIATNGTYRSGIYTSSLRQLGYEPIVPDPRFQNDVIHRMIYDRDFGLKSNPAGVDRRAMQLSEKTLCYFRDRGADVVILGCTDLSLLGLATSEMGMCIVDSNESMARALIREASSLGPQALGRIGQRGFDRLKANS